MNISAGEFQQSKKNTSFRLENSDLEGEGFIKKLYLLKKNSSKIKVYNLLKILTCGMITILCFWF